MTKSKVSPEHKQRQLFLISLIRSDLFLYAIYVKNNLEKSADSTLDKAVQGFDNLVHENKVYESQEKTCTVIQLHTPKQIWKKTA